MDSPTKLYLIRHGEVEARYHRVFGGRIDMELSPRGHDQASALARYLDRVRFDVIYASPMKRVQQTLLQLAERQKKTPVVLPELREVDFGSWTGMGWEQIQATFGVTAYEWLDQLDRNLIAEAEPRQDFQGRIQRCVDQILAESRGQTAAVVCHGGVIRMFLAVLLDLPLRKMAGFEFGYASLTVVDWFPHKVEVQLLNFEPWREA